MGTKMAVAFTVIFMTHIQKQLLVISPNKLLIWKRFIDGIFPLWTLPKSEINNFIDFALRLLRTNLVKDSFELKLSPRISQPK